MNRAKFFDACRKGVMGPTLDDDEVAGASAILDAMAGAPIAFTAYALATAWHETAHTMKPIKEFGGPNYYLRMYDVKGQRPALAHSMGNTTPGDGAKYAGRGFVQLTWKTNYARAERELGVPLVDEPDRAMEPDVAAKIMRRGMEEGWFTGRAFANLLPSNRIATRDAFVSARRIINGADRAGPIADYAVQFQAALQVGGWA